MAVSTETSRVSYSGDGTTDTFAYTFPIQDEDHLAVYVDDDLQTITTHYTVTGVGVETGGNVVFGTAPALGTVVLIVRQITFKQETEYTANDAFPATTHESALDYLMMAVQHLKEAIDRAAKQSITVSSVLSLVIPEPTAGYALGWNTGATGLTNLASTGTLSVSTLASSLIDDTTATEMYQTIGVPVAMGYATKSCADASATEAFTGLGFEPSYVELNAVIDATPCFSDGIDNGATQVCRYGYGAAAAGQVAWDHGHSIHLYQSAIAAYSGTISTFTTDGWVWNWVKTGATASGTARIIYKAVK